jgi:hypothetical protein
VNYGNTIPDLRLVFEFQGREQELSIPAEFVTAVILPAVEHEVGHVVAAAHHGATIIGIGVGFVNKRGRNGIFFQAVYGWEEVTKEVECIVKAAGPAADLMFRGQIDNDGASGDLADIEQLSGQKSLDAYLAPAQEILARYQPEIGWLSARLRASLVDGKRRVMISLPNGQMTALFIDQEDLEQCPEFTKELPSSV